MHILEATNLLRNCLLV
uniref:Uncharacterized protein n=1 Tax=Lepeophtheirus salmonis TaxID=72036 RepID=A0A0K2VGZ2_LEPSM